MKSTQKIITSLVVLFLMGFSLLETGCTNTANLTVLEPADINLPQDINKIALVNRYKFAQGGGRGVWNVLEGIFTGENIGQDRRGAETSLFGLQDALRNSPRFEFTMPNVQLRGGAIGGGFPEPLSTQEVQDICKQYNSDALITIESFDSDSWLDYEFTTKEKEIKKKTVIDTTHIAVATVKVNVGWRMYDAETGGLLDQFMMIEEARFDAEGSTQSRARANLPNQEYVSSDMGARTGMRYSRRISPTWVTVSRTYYTKGSDKLKWARDLARTDDWSGAADLWEQEAKSEERKAKKRATFNMALAREIEGDLEGAIDWAKKASRLGVGQANNYYRTLARRQQDQIRLQQQMNGR